MKCATFLRICRPFVKLRLVRVQKLTFADGYGPLIHLMKDAPPGSKGTSVKLDNGYVAVAGERDAVLWLEARANKKRS